jgi:tRNA-dihydrouridine synthase
MKSFWHNLPKPFFALAPMDAVTDTVFRRVVARAGRPDVFYTEFINTDGFCHPKGRRAVESRLLFTPDEQPLVAQIWGTNPDHFAQTTLGLKDLGYQAIDINMGCPAKDVTKKGAGSALIQTPELAAEIIAATKTAGLPVSVKTRIGYNTAITEEWLGFLLHQDLAALIVHARTRKQMSKVPARWEEIARAVQLRNQIAPQTLIIGNGDVGDRAEGLRRIAETGADGVMIGRGVFADIFCFEHQPRQHTQAEYFDLMRYHLGVWQQTWPAGTANYHALKRFYKIYIKGFAGASELRNELMYTNCIDEALETIARHSKVVLD